MNITNISYFNDIAQFCGQKESRIATLLIIKNVWASGCDIEIESFSEKKKRSVFHLIGVVYFGSTVLS